MSKIDRIIAQSAKIEAQRVVLPKDAAWIGDFLTEYRAFPNGKNDDMLDALAYALNYQKGRVSPDAKVVSFPSPFLEAVRQGRGWNYFENHSSPKPW